LVASVPFVEWFVIILLEKYYQHSQINPASKPSLLDELFETWSKSKFK